MIHLRGEGRETSWASKHGFNTSRFRNHFSKYFFQKTIVYIFSDKIFVIEALL